MPRPTQREVPAPALLDHFVEYDRAQRRKGRTAAITQSGFARTLDKTVKTVRSYFADANLPWPPVSPGDLVLLLDDAPPHELLWISDAWCLLNGRNHQELLFKPASYLRAVGVADGAREMHQVVARQLRGAGPDNCGEIDGWVDDRTGQHLAAQFELRYGQRSNSFYVRAHLVDQPHVDVDEIFNVDPRIIVRPKPGQQVDLVDLERLWREVIPPYSFPSRS